MSDLRNDDEPFDPLTRLMFGSRKAKGNRPAPVPPAPFQIGDRVRSVNPDTNRTVVMTVTGWREATIGGWVVDVDGHVNGYRPEWLEIVDETEPFLLEEKFPTFPISVQHKDGYYAIATGLSEYDGRMRLSLGGSLVNPDDYEPTPEPMVQVLSGKDSTWITAAMWNAILSGDAAFFTVAPKEGFNWSESTDSQLCTECGRPVQVSALGKVNHVNVDGLAERYNHDAVLPEQNEWTEASSWQDMMSGWGGMPVPDEHNENHMIIDGVSTCMYTWPNGDYCGKQYPHSGEHASPEGEQP